MDSTRKQVAALLAAELPDTYTVIHYPRTPEAIGANADGTVIVERRTITPVGVGTNAETFYVWVLTGRDDEEAAEDDLDAQLEEVKGAIARASRLTPPTAERTMYGNFHAYRLEIILRTED